MSATEKIRSCKKWSKVKADFCAQASLACCTEANVNRKWHKKTHNWSKGCNKIVMESSHSQELIWNQRASTRLGLVRKACYTFLTLWLIHLAEPNCNNVTRQWKRNVWWWQRVILSGSRSFNWKTHLTQNVLSLYFSFSASLYDIVDISIIVSTFHVLVAGRMYVKQLLRLNHYGRRTVQVTA